MTNFEKITKNEETFSDFIVESVGCDLCLITPDNRPPNCGSNCKTTVIAWLHSEAEDGQEAHR